MMVAESAAAAECAISLCKKAEMSRQTDRPTALATALISRCSCRRAGGIFLRLTSRRRRRHCPLYRRRDGPPRRQPQGGQCRRRCVNFNENVTQILGVHLRNRCERAI